MNMILDYNKDIKEANNLRGGKYAEGKHHGDNTDPPINHKNVHTTDYIIAGKQSL
ncbi:hypothetical protein CLOBOL_01595 [Enterocloster bolteae ATCC BAA-613]|jgi:hypothetical protein|uniref:Uncharacterized protein n=1 Tax=Enterocloster bolteae (strain ATCC BAA-613 / DSM 15670 / CCUG 46953 / JCM 12243 / WAL 16351) TaxID=411902 RepID=A8RLE7_ENTBW|nr:hypothetical protein CLOBOL_01595 [Enterocloster bolteae ATCC BAA-613]